jgi:sulfur carrier protein ThiS
MTVGLLDLDRTGFPNVALMKLSAWEQAHGNDTVLLRDTRPVDKLYASAVFTWNRRKATAVADLGGRVGGSGVSLNNELPAEAEAMRPDYALYGLDYGVGYLMRGCIWQCKFCVVPEKEGKPREVATIEDLLNRESRRARPFVVLLDNEFFWREAWALARLEEFTARGIDVCFSQGLDVRVVTPALARALARAPFWNVPHSRRQVTFAFDDVRTEPLFRRGVERLLTAGLKGWNLQSFILVGFNSTLDEDLHRIGVVKEYGIDPFVMVYRDYHTGQAARDPALRNLARWTNRRLHKTCAFADYWPEVRRRQQRLLPMVSA